MKKINKFILPSVLVFLSAFAYGQPGTTPPGGGTAPGVPGTTGPGRVASPIDMYVYILVILAILIIFYFAKKYKVQKI
ncbi:signal peptidase [Chryseobacterium mulctrae]|uniref:signal peptidase n=1 Tax=Chryseobacterium mulctrae TaxID=2576777 RepID=UPI0016235270|nr:signal peptidase [Chryseobacterium mulctrae]